MRVELSTILIKYVFKIAIQFWARRDNSVVPLAYGGRYAYEVYLPVVLLARVCNPSWGLCVVRDGTSRIEKERKNAVLAACVSVNGHRKQASITGAHSAPMIRIENKYIIRHVHCYLCDYRERPVLGGTDQDMIQTQCNKQRRYRNK